MNPLEAAALSDMTGYTYVPCGDGYIPPLEAWWWEDMPTRLNWWHDPRDHDKYYHD